MSAEKQIVPGHAQIEGTELSGSVKGWGVELAEVSEYPDAIAVQSKDIPGLITWLTQQWAEHNKAGLQEKA